MVLLFDLGFNFGLPRRVKVLLREIACIKLAPALALLGCLAFKPLVLKVALQFISASFLELGSLVLGLVSAWVRPLLHLLFAAFVIFADLL